MANEPRGAAGTGEARGAGDVVYSKGTLPAPTLLPIGPAMVTFIGGAEAGNVGSTSWGTDATGRINFPLKEAVLIDPTKAKSVIEREFMEHVITKARNNRFYSVEDAGPGIEPHAEVKHPEPHPRTQPNPTRGK